MKSDLNGCSTTQIETEHYEEFKNGKKTYFQYDYRDRDGELFSCVAHTLNICRMKRNAWLAEREQKKRFLS